MSKTCPTCNQKIKDNDNSIYGIPVTTVLYDVLICDYTPIDSTIDEPIESVPYELELINA